MAVLGRAILVLAWGGTKVVGGGRGGDLPPPPPLPISVEKVLCSEGASCEFEVDIGIMI